QRPGQHRRQRPGPSPRRPPQTAPRPPLGPQCNELEPMKNRTNSRTVIPSEARNLSSVIMGSVLKDYEYCFTRFASARARRASGNARLVRTSTVRGRRDRVGCCEVRRQSPEPPAPRLSACLRSSSRRRCRASFRPRTSRASARTSHPVLPGWNTPARRFVLLSARSWFSMREDNINRVGPVCRKRFSKLLFMNGRRENLTGAKYCAKIFFERGNNFAAEIANLRFGQRRFSALERHAHQQRIFSGRNVFPAEKV